MSKFINNCVNALDENFDKNNYEKISSLNKSCFDKKLVENAKIVIVGTLTPANGMNHGFYYSSDKNKVYKLLDYCLNTEDNGLAKLKQELKQNQKSEEIIKQIKMFLFNHNLVFIDVIRDAIRKKGSAYDDDIIQYTLDFDAFENCNNNQKFVCTSKNAKVCLEKIRKFDNITICYQDRFHCKPEDWKKEIAEK